MSQDNKIKKWELQVFKNCKTSEMYIILLSQKTLYYFLKNCNMSADKKTGNYLYSRRVLKKLGFLDKKFPACR